MTPLISVLSSGLYLRLWSTSLTMRICSLNCLLELEWLASTMHPRAAAQVAHLPPPAHRGEPAQGQAVAPQGKGVLRQEEGIAAQPLSPLYGRPPPFVVESWLRRVFPPERLRPAGGIELGKRGKG